MPPAAPTNLPASMAFAALFAVMISACSMPEIPGVYRINIQQGNVISQEMLDQLEPGMDRRKVRFILGTPMLTDTFNENRWDYFYSLREGSSDPVHRRISIFFEEEKLVSIKGDIQRGDARRPVTPRKETIVTVPPNYEGEGLLSALRPEFLGGKKKPRRVTKEPESGPSPDPDADTAGESALAPKTEDAEPVTAATAPPALVPVPSAGDEAYLKRLFEGFGKRDAGSAPGAEDREQAASGAAVVYEDDDLGIARKPEPNDSEEASADDGGFIKRLIERLRRTPNAGQGTPATESAAPPAAPEPAAP